MKLDNKEEFLMWYVIGAVYAAGTITVAVGELIYLISQI